MPLNTQSVCKYIMTQQIEEMSSLPNQGQNQARVIVELVGECILATLEPLASDNMCSAIKAAATTLTSDERNGKGTTPEMAKMKVLLFKATPAYKAVIDCIVRNLPDVNLYNHEFPIKNISQMKFDTIIFPPGIYRFESLNVISVRVSDFGRVTAKKVDAHSHEIAQGDIFVAKGPVDIDVEEKCAFIIMTSKLGIP